LYAKDQDKPGHNVQISVNRPYADGGFTQVNYEMNELLRNWIQKTANEVIPFTDVFEVQVRHKNFA
ncbi:MAG: hypothetical protein ACXWC8_21865, partial [Limisphaerales bacterium]